MPIAVLYPRYDHPAIEERYASWQTQMLLKRGAGVSRTIFYEAGEPAEDVAADVEESHVLVITDPLLLPSPRLAERLVAALGDAAAAVPVSNAATHPQQQRPPAPPYLTLRELQATMEAIESEPPALERVTWDQSDPGAFLCKTEMLDHVRVPLREALAGREVAISKTDYVHRWSSLRGQTRFDLLDRIGTDAKSILEFGCGEAPLGEALKKRQKCRVVGIELDPAAAAVAEKRIDAVYRGDVREIVSIMDERFDWIIGGDIVEHLDEPWSFLDDLRNVANPGGHLLLSIPNLANASLVTDLLRGRFDYVYMGLTCVGHLRFFTRQTIADMLTIAGWTVVAIDPQDAVATPARDELLTALDRAGLPYSRDDVTATGFYVVARNGA
ncbi:MAG TPA: class I SAM-dependent methyltransferase [Thermoanaerobaculia bacterium]|nr:class I SAM-dependent methyltransferase [Thermoanaerobaculia bacterium]